MHRCRGNTKNDKGIPLAMLPRQRVEASLASLQRLLWHRWLWWCEYKSNPPSQHYSGPQIDRNDVQYILNVGIYLSIYLRVKITFLHGNPLLVHEQHSLVPRLDSPSVILRMARCPALTLCNVHFETRLCPCLPNPSRRSSWSIEIQKGL